MSHANATTGVASSGNTVGFSRGRKTTGEQVLGNEEKLGELVYKLACDSGVVVAKRAPR
jgi:hypothetical protein